MGVLQAAARWAAVCITIDQALYPESWGEWRDPTVFVIDHPWQPPRSRRLDGFVQLYGLALADLPSFQAGSARDNQGEN